jgi:hypothetical protein
VGGGSLFGGLFRGGWVKAGTTRLFSSKKIIFIELHYRKSDYWIPNSYIHVPVSELYSQDLSAFLAAAK